MAVFEGDVAAMFVDFENFWLAFWIRKELNDGYKWTA